MLRELEPDRVVEQRPHEGHGGRGATLEDVLAGTSLGTRKSGVKGNGVEAGPGVCRGQEDSFDKACWRELAGGALEEAGGSSSLLDQRWIGEEINGTAAWQRTILEHVESRPDPHDQG
jgi:hypothetical protein